MINIVSDYFLSDFARGAELNDDVLIKALNLNKVYSRDLVSINPNDFYIISNFVQLGESAKQQLIKNKNYLIYEHDHKYVVTRNPYLLIEQGFHLEPKYIENPTGIVPKDYLINQDFYLNAKIVICLTNWHETQLNLNLEGIKTINIHGSLWSEEDLNLIDDLRNRIKKTNPCAIFMDAITLGNSNKLQQGENIKNKIGSHKYCVDNKIRYKFLPRIPIRTKFLETLASFNAISFFPNIPETCSRLLTEAKMLGLKTYTNDFSGASREFWFNLEGQELTDHFRNTLIPNAINLFKSYL